MAFPGDRLTIIGITYIGDLAGEVASGAVKAVKSCSGLPMATVAIYILKYFLGVCLSWSLVRFELSVEIFTILLIIVDLH